METGGEGGGGGDAERRGSSELGRLLEAIGSSEVPEKRIPLVKQLEEEFSADDLGLLLQGLLASWVDSTCSGVSHCTLHRSILQVALKCSDLDIADHLGQFFTLGAKASSWCAKHLQWSAKCIDHSQVVEEEEHNRLRHEVNLLSLSISTKLLDIAAKCITVLGLEVAEVEEGQGAAQEECVLNKADDLFPLETMAVEVGPAPAHLAVGLSPDQEASRRCMHCGSEKTPRWLRGSEKTLCSAWGRRFLKGFLLDPNPRRRGRPSTKETGRRCTRCATENTPQWREGPEGPHRRGRPSTKKTGRRCTRCATEKTPRWREGAEGPRCRGRPSTKETGRRCTRCATEKTPQWREGPEGPRTLCNACGLVFRKKRRLLPEYRPANSPAFSPHREMHRRNETSATGEMQVELVLDAMNSFFSQGSEVSWGEAGAERANDEEEEELEWLSNKDAFPSVETMAMEVEEEAFSPDVPRARSRGHWCVTAMETSCRQANVPPHSDLRAEKETVRRRRRRCTHCATEKTSLWRDGSGGARTLCNACGAVFKKNGRLLPEYRPANSPAFSPLLHSNKYSRALEMHHRNETSATGEMQVELMDPPANSPTPSPLEGYSSLRRVLEEESSAGGHVAAAEARRGEESMEVQLLPERPPVDSPAFSLVPHRRVLKRRRKSEAQTFAAIRATAKAGRADRAAARLAAMDN